MPTYLKATLNLGLPNNDNNYIMKLPSGRVKTGNTGEVKWCK